MCRKPSFLAIGLIAKLLGFEMWVTMRPGLQVLDPFQRQVFMIMPWVAALAMSQAAAEPLLHRIAANILAVAQQKYLNSKWSHLEQFQMPAEVHRNEQIL